MAEWSIAAVLKTVDLKGFGGSNPSLSARKEDFGKLKLFDYQSLLFSINYDEILFNTENLCIFVNKCCLFKATMNNSIN